FEEVLAYNRAGKGGVLHIGHFNNWEVLGLAAGYIFDKMAFVARPQANKYVDAELTKMRVSTGSVMVNSYNPFFSSFKLLKKGYMIGILSDQSVITTSSLYMNFLGRPAEVPPMSAVLALKLRLPIFPVKSRREGGKLIITAQAPILPGDTPYSDEAVTALTAKLYQEYESWIKENPSSWLWAHNRWKREARVKKIMDAQEGKSHE
ncbi:MAG: lysophospholipid acyltransferase family protein, partial [Elusimicrobiota bacterium]|nr:lysophospholipid acyltransferase family protein [Elusimicrobiota bacterium]